MRKHWVLALVVLMGFTPLFATDYYVKNGGNDAASGLDDDNAWETIAKVNGESFSGDDNIYFNRGDEWHETLTVPDSGTSGHQIRYGVYGNGAAPVISETDVVTGWTEATEGETRGDINEIADNSRTADYIYYYKVTTDSAGTLQDFRVYSYSASAGIKFKLALYTDDGDKAGSLIANTTSAEITSMANGDWNTLTVTSGASLDASTTYWIAGWSDTSLFYGRNALGALDSDYDSEAYNGFPATASQDGAQDDGCGIVMTVGVALADIWQATVTAAAVYYVTIDGIAGRLQASAVACTENGDYYFAANTLYLFSDTDPSGKTITASIRGTAIDIDENDYITIEGLCLERFPLIGIDGTNTTSLQVNYCRVDSQLPYNSLSIRGILLDTSTDAIIYNCDVFRNDIGIYVEDGSGNIIKNCRIYANRKRGLYDNGINCTYDYNHIFANGIGRYGKFDTLYDVSGGTDGGNNLSGLLRPLITDFEKYTPIVNFSVDDVGSRAGTDEYVDSIKSTLTDRSIYGSFGIVAGAMDAGEWTKADGWDTDGHEICSHSWSHQYSDDTTYFAIQYTGSGDPATMTIATNTLSTSCTGAGGDDLSIDLTHASYDALAELVAHIHGQANYTCTIDGDASTLVHSDTLADVTGQDIKTSAYDAQLDKERLTVDELSASKAEIESEISGLTCDIYIYPGSIRDSDTDGWADTANYVGGRALIIDNQDAHASEDTTLENGVNKFSLPNVSTEDSSGKTESEIKGRAYMLSFFSGMWGVPISVYCHDDTDGFTAEELGWFLDALLEDATYKTLGEIVTYLETLTNVTGDIYATSGGTTDFTLNPHSPCIDKGTDVSLTEDYNGSSVPLRGDMGTNKVFINVGGNLYVIPSDPTEGSPDIGVYEYLAPYKFWDGHLYFRLSETHYLRIMQPDL